MVLGSSLLAGVVIISRPPALFPSPGTNITSASSFMEDSDLEAKQPYDLVGLGFALTVPLLSGWVAIITRELRRVNILLR